MGLFQSIRGAKGFIDLFFSCIPNEIIVSLVLTRNLLIETSKFWKICIPFILCVNFREAYLRPQIIEKERINLRASQNENFLFCWCIQFEFFFRCIDFYCSFFAPIDKPFSIILNSCEVSYLYRCWISRQHDITPFW